MPTKSGDKRRKKITRREQMEIIGNETPESKEIKLRYYNLFWLMHLTGAIVLLGSFLSIVIVAAVGDLHTKVYVTLGALKHISGSTPSLVTDFEVIGKSHLYWFFFIPLICGLYHFFLALPGCILPRRSPFMTTTEENELAERLAKENEFGELKRNENPMYYAWFQNNLVYGASGLKFLVYGLCSGLYVVMVSQQVGITDLFQLSGNFLLIFFGFISLWNLEYSKGVHVHKAIGDAEDESEHGNLLDEDKESVKRNTINGMSGFGFSLLLSCVAIALPYLLILVYFSVAVAGDSGAIDPSVYISVSYFLVYIPMTLIMMAMFHMDIAFSSDYMMLELVMTTLHFLAYTIIVLLTVLLPRNDEFLYGIIST